MFVIVNNFGALGVLIIEGANTIAGVFPVVTIAAPSNTCIVATGATVPNTETFKINGANGSLLGIVITPVLGTVVEFGVPDTVNVAVPADAIEPTGVICVIVNPVLAVIVPTVNAAVPVFLTVNVFATFGVLIIDAGKTFAGVLPVVIIVAPSNTCIVATGAAVPNTDTFNINGVNGSLLGIVITPVLGTVVEFGVPDTVNVAVPADAIEPTGVTCVTVNPALAVIVPTVNAAVPVFLTVNVFATFGVLITEAGKTFAGVLPVVIIVAPSNTCIVATGTGKPNTDTFNTNGVNGSLLGIVITPVLGTVSEFGVPDTVNVAEPAGAIEPTGVTCVTVNPALAVIVPTVNAAAPVFVMVNVLATFGVLITDAGKTFAGVLPVVIIVAPSNTCIVALEPETEIFTT